MSNSSREIFESIDRAKVDDKLKYQNCNDIYNMNQFEIKN